MLETIRQFAEEQLTARGEASENRAAHARYFAGREADIIALWDSPRQREAYDWFTVELANLRTAFRWAADHGDLDAGAAITAYAAFLGPHTLQVEWAYREVFNTNDARCTALTPWLEHYNNQRRHSGSAIGGKPPISRLSPT